MLLKKELLLKFQSFARNILVISQTSVLVFLDTERKSYIIMNHLFLTFKYYIYISRDHRKLNFGRFKKRIKRNKNTEKTLAINNSDKCNRKWQIIYKIITLKLTEGIHLK